MEPAASAAEAARWKLEDEPAAELERPWVCGSAGVRIELRTAEGVDIAGEVRVIQDVEGLPAKLEVFAFGKVEGLAENSVEVGETVKAQLVASAGSVLFKKGLRDGKSPRHGVSREKGHRVKKVGVAIHQGIGDIPAIVGSVQQQVIDRDLIGCRARGEWATRGAESNRCGQRERQAGPIG